MNKSANGWIYGFLGVLVFSGSLPATRIAVLEMDPFFLTWARAALAGIMAAGALIYFRQSLPGPRTCRKLAFVVSGVVIGFPLFTALALEHITAARSLVYMGMLPLSTAIFGVVFGGERPRPAFWAFSITGSLLVAGFAAWQSGGSFSPGDGYMLAAIIVCGVGYAQGGILSRTLGGWQVISWALVLALPIVVIALGLSHFPNPETISVSAWSGLAYVSAFSMWIGFIFWYKGLALGGVAGVGQIQLLQPFLGFIPAALLLHEPVSAAMVGIALGVAICVAGSRRFA
ncbi:DMT family transporter [Phaeovibrio sulfidiphilus]|uniref:DMT family transporter n=1 Tax=Phaeovibrio sulfidiphilus TaxID=1220600 RepID=A0A8J6YNT7_9PROT|nr:DMT family transporter [Phaeovibrio sulfidiphilus]